MAKVQGPLFSISAAGTVGQVLQFRRLRGRMIVSAPTVPTAAPSAPQTAERARCADAAAAWRVLDDETRNRWIALATTHNLNPWLEFFREWQRQRIDAPELPLLPAD